MAWQRTADGSVEDETGKVIFFSTQRFVADICMGDCCFICGASPGSKSFNDEHILPKWILRRYNLFGRAITLPNHTEHRYDQYTIRCCVDCNELMGSEIETPISEIIGAGPNAVQNYIAQNGALKFFVWMGLIFLKSHLKDKSLRVHLDRRKPDDRIADQYEWEKLHHIHCIVRCFYNDAYISKGALGTFLGLAASVDPPWEDFDFGDLYAAQTLFIRLGHVGLFAVFDDSCGATNGLMPRLERITGPLSSLQLREIMTDLAFLNLSHENRPKFWSEFDLQNERVELKADVPGTYELGDLNFQLRGALMRQSLKHALPSLTFRNRSKDEIENLLNEGKLSFLFDDEGNFIRESVQPLS